MNYDIRTVQVSSSPLAVVRCRASLRELSKVVPDACGAVWRVIRAEGIAGAGRNVALYLDDEINLEVGVEMADPFAGHGEVVGSTLPGGRVATTTHYGPYSQLAQAHEAIRLWCQNNEHALAGPNWELYGHRKDEWKSNPTQIRTDVYYLLDADRRS